MKQAGKIDHEFVFFQQDGAPIVNLSYPYDRWRYVLERTQIRYREPYNARHSYVSWSLMMGKNILLVAKEDGHSVHTMLKTYARWTEGATEADVAKIRRAMERSPAPTAAVVASDRSPGASPAPPEFATNLPPEGGWGRLSWRKYKHFKEINGGADGTRSRK